MGHWAFEEPNPVRRLYGYDGKIFACHWWFVGWEAIALGVSLALDGPNIQIHLPFGFIKIGRKSPPSIVVARWVNDTPKGAPTTHDAGASGV